MTRRFALHACWSLLAPVALTGAALAADAVPGPGAAGADRDDVAAELLEALDADRDSRRKDPARVRKLVDEILLPHFDTDYAARLVLGKHWRNATPDQRKRFIDAFYQSLLRNYGSALAEFTADRMTMLPFQGDLASGHGHRAHRGEAQQRHSACRSTTAARDARRAGRPGTSRSRASPT